MSSKTNLGSSLSLIAVFTALNFVALAYQFISSPASQRIAFVNTNDLSGKEVERILRSIGERPEMKSAQLALQQDQDQLERWKSQLAKSQGKGRQSLKKNIAELEKSLGERRSDFERKLWGNIQKEARIFSDRMEKTIERIRKEGGYEFVFVQRQQGNGKTVFVDKASKNDITKRLIEELGIEMEGVKAIAKNK